MRRTTLAIGVLGLAWGAAGDIEYTVIRLYPLPGASTIVPLRLNNSGQVVGWSQGPQAITRGFVWSVKDGMTELPMPDGLNLSIARDINDDGIITGHATIDVDGNDQAWVYQDGHYTMLGGFAEPIISLAWGINASRQVAGFSPTWDGPGSEHSFRWTPGEGFINIIPDQSGRAMAVNDQGWVTGVYGWVAAAYRWRGPGLVDTLPIITDPRDINNQGNIAGAGPGQDEPAHGDAYFYSDATGSILIANLGEHDTAEGLNEDNTVVGTTIDPPTAWVWSAQRGLVELTSLIDPAEGIFIDAARDINDKGQIVGGGYENGLHVGVLLTPVGRACEPDLDGNGVLDLFDFLAFVNAFSAGDARADCDGNGVFSLFDFLCFLNAFKAGC